MNGNSIVADTNILIYLFKGDKTIEAFLQDKQIYISFITKIELFSHQKLTKSESEFINAALEEITIV